MDDVKLKKNRKQHRKLLEKYANLEKKLDSGFSSEMEEEMGSKGCDLTVNPMLYRPYALLRYVIIQGLMWCQKLETPLLDLIDESLMKCGKGHPISYFYYRPSHLKLGLKVIFRHIQYGPSELDRVYCLDQWSRYFKKYCEHKLPKSHETYIDDDDEVVEALSSNSELKKYLESFSIPNETGPNLELYPQEIFNKVLKNLAESTFNIIRSGKVKEPNPPFELFSILYNRTIYKAASRHMSYVLYARLFEYIQSDKFDDFSMFMDHGVPEFFTTWLKSCNTMASEIIRKRNVELAREERRRRKIAARNERLAHGGKRISQGMSQTKAFNTTSMFGNSEPVKKGEDWKNTLERPVRTKEFEKERLEERLETKLRDAKKLNHAIEVLQSEIKKLRNSLEAKERRLELRITQEETVWDDIEELQRKLK